MDAVKIPIHKPPPAIVEIAKAEIFQSGHGRHFYYTAIDFQAHTNVTAQARSECIQFFRPFLAKFDNLMAANKKSGKDEILKQLELSVDDVPQTILDTLAIPLELVERVTVRESWRAWDGKEMRLLINRHASPQDLPSGVVEIKFPTVGEPEISYYNAHAMAKFDVTRQTRGLFTGPLAMMNGAMVQSSRLKKLDTPEIRNAFIRAAQAIFPEREHFEVTIRKVAANVSNLGRVGEAMSKDEKNSAVSSTLLEINDLSDGTLLFRFAWPKLPKENSFTLESLFSRRPISGAFTHIAELPIAGGKVHDVRTIEPAINGVLRINGLDDFPDYQR